MWYSCNRIVIVSFLTCILGGCAADSTPSASSKTAAACAVHSECLVCKKNADLACIDVDVDGKTPFLDYSGKRYYFCSDECRSEFQKNPMKFVNAK